MKGWEIYAKDWGCGDWDEVWDNHVEKLDRLNHNVAYGNRLFQPSKCWKIGCNLFFFRQPVPVQVRHWLHTNLCV